MPDDPASTTQLSRRAILGSALAVAAGSAARVEAAAPIILNDASRLDPTPVARHIVVGADPDAALLARLRSELRDAATAGRPVAIGVARHSMGGQSLARDGTAFTFNVPYCIPNSAAGTYRASAGTRWRDVIRTLDPIGLSPAVMQSNNDFGVTSTLSVNAHGWPVPHGPFGSTVRGFRLMLADGSVVTCSRQENAELFGLVMGGYGLFGIILDVEADTAPNALLAPSFVELPSVAFAERFVAACADPSVIMAYGRLNVARHDFLGQTLMVTYRSVPEPPTELPPASTGGVLSALTRDVYRAQTGSEIGKRIRWVMETKIGPHTLEHNETRNALLNEPVSNLASHNLRRTDILHEYFVPPERLEDFLAACREVMPRHRQELLNVTLRFVQADQYSLLAYAPAPRIAAVMSFSQLMTADADMRAMTQELVEHVIACGGSFYLPYRLHARREQVARAYPALDRFAALKRQYDPGLLFRNTLWDAWMATPATP